MRQNELIEKLENLVDATSLTDVVLALARMCNEKAEHDRVNWNAVHTAATWDNAAKKLDRISDKLGC